MNPMANPSVKGTSCAYAQAAPYLELQELPHRCQTMTSFFFHLKGVSFTGQPHKKSPAMRGFLCTLRALFSGKGSC